MERKHKQINRLAKNNLNRTESTTLKETHYSNFSKKYYAFINE